MKQAISIYLGGEIFNAEDCDYNSSKKLGLKCFLCHEPVFLVVRKDSTFFSHYSAKKSPRSSSCENRIKLKSNQEKIQKIISENRNQRLKFFNKKLVDIIKKTSEISPKTAKKAAKKYKNRNQKLIDPLALQIYFQSLDLRGFDSIYGELMLRNASTYSKDFIKNKSPELRDYLNEKGYKSMVTYFSTLADPGFHLRVCKEVAEFLKSSQSAFFWEEIVPIYAELFIEDLTAGYQNLSPQKKEKRRNYFLSTLIVSLIFNTKWQLIIPKNSKLKLAPL